jgi:hypothetical protein
VSEEVFGRPLLKPLYAFPDGFCPNTSVFSDERKRFPSWIDGCFLPDREKVAGDDSPKGPFLEWMSEVANTVTLERLSLHML